MADTVIQELGLNISQFEQSVQKAETLWDNLDTRSTRMGKESPFKKQTDDLLKYNTQLRSGSTLFKNLSADPKVLAKEITKVSNEYVKLITNQNKSAKAGTLKETQEQIKATRSLLDSLNKKYDETIAKQEKAAKAPSPGSSGKGSGIGAGLSDKLLGGASGILGAFGIGLGATEIITGIVSVRAEYQRLGKQLEVTLGSSSAAAAAQKLITDFANKTPHEIAGVTSAFNRLVDVGIVPTEKQLFQLSDIALSKGKTINDYVEAIADAQTGEFERLKEFGIKAAKNGDQVSFAFKGQTTAVKNTTEAINDYLIGLGSVAGVSGQTAEAGKLLEGRYSTLKDTFAGIANDIGILLQPAMEKLLDVTQQAATGLANYIKDLANVSGKNGGIRAFFQSIFDPHQFNVDATEALFQANEAAIAAGKKPGADTDPLEKKRRELAEQNKKSEAERKAAAAKAKAEKDAKEAATKQKQIDLDITREKEKQVDERKKLADELVKLESEADKQRLETLTKDGAEYLALKQKLDLAEIDLERKKLIEIGQLATGTPYYDKKLQKVVVKPNTAYALPANTEAIFDRKRQAVTTGTETDFYNKQESDALAADEQSQALRLADIARKSGEVELQMRQKLLDAEGILIRTAGESEADYEKRKNAALLAIRLEYYQKLLALAEKDPSQKAQILGLKETIQGLKKELTDNSAQTKTGPQDLWDLLGIKFDDDAKKNDQLKAATDEAVRTVVEGANNLLSQQLQNDQARISSIDAQLQAKQNEVNIELELQRQGLANNLAVRRQEQQQLQQERAKAIEAQRRDQAIQIVLNTILQESQMALALAKIIANAASFGPLFPFIVGAEIAAMFAVFAAGVGQIAALPKYHDGDEVTSETARNRTLRGSRRSDEVDARLQIGEGITRKESYQPNKKLFAKLNKLGRGLRASDLSGLLDGTGVSLSDAMQQGDLLLINQANDARSYQPDTELHRRVDGLSSRLDTLINETRKGNRKGREVLPDGRIKEVDEHGNVTIVRHT